MRRNMLRVFCLLVITLPFIVPAHAAPPDQPCEQECITNYSFCSSSASLNRAQCIQAGNKLQYCNGVYATEQAVCEAALNDCLNNCQ
jgi:hypothetical protein